MTETVKCVFQVWNWSVFFFGFFFGWTLLHIIETILSKRRAKKDASIPKELGIFVDGKKIVGKLESDEQSIKFLQSMQKLEVKDGDTVILSHPGKLSQQAVEGLRTFLKDKIKNFGQTEKAILPNPEVSRPKEPEKAIPKKKIEKRG